MAGVMVTQGVVPALVVLEDHPPTELDHYYEPGHIAEGNAAAMIQARRSSAFLPIDPALAKYSPLSAWSKHEYGSGVVHNSPATSTIVRSVLYLIEGYHAIHWCARIERDPHWRGAVEGSIRMVGDTTQRGVTPGAVVHTEGAFQLRELQGNEWFLSGRAQIAGRREGLAAFALQGNPRGIRIKWFAVSQTQ